VFNGPHLDKDKKELEKELKDKNDNDDISEGLISGICDPDLSANNRFLKGLAEKLNDEGYALLTFSDYSKDADYSREACQTQTEYHAQDYLKDPLINLLATARKSNLVATLLSVSEFCPNEKLAMLRKIGGVSKREVMLWKNIIFRKKDEFNLHKATSGFLAAASEIADIYCTKEPVTEELYLEMIDRMETFYRMYCQQVGWMKGTEKEFILSGFSLPYLHGNSQIEKKFVSLIHGEDFEPDNEFIPKHSGVASLGKEILDKTDIHRLEIIDHTNGSVERKERQRLIDKKEAMNPVSSATNRSFGEIQNAESRTSQVRYRIHLYEPRTDEKEEKEIKNNANQATSHLDENKELLDKILSIIEPMFYQSYQLKKKQGKKEVEGEYKYLSYCLFSRYSGAANKSALFYLLSSTEDLPFLQSLRTFGRIANTAANNMLSSLAAYKAAERAARAAVFARNFSHITGSHVISNPNFRNTLTGVQLISEQSPLRKMILKSAGKEKELWKNLATFNNGITLTSEYEKEASNMNINMQQIDDILLENTRRFHDYLQGRFDFIARAIDDTTDQPEPVWFVKDLVEGFLSQTAYLDNLVADIGLRRENMKIHLTIERKTYEAAWIPIPIANVAVANELNEDSKKHEAFPKEVCWREVKSNEATDSDHSIEVPDTMIALPGGMVAAHAFYSLLENIIRNSIKYGAFKSETEQDHYQLTIKIEKIENEIKPSSHDPEQKYYNLFISDNYSLSLKNDDSNIESEEHPYRSLQKRLEKSFVKASGEPQTEDLGMMEMQACAQLICRPDEKDLYPAYCSVEDPKQKSHNRKLNLCTLKPNSNDFASKFLTYRLTLNRPYLLGCLTSKQKSRPSDSFWSNEPSQLSKQMPFLFVVDGEWLKDNCPSSEEPRNNISVMCRNDLPYRTFILFKTEDDCRDCQDKIASISQKVRYLIDSNYYQKIFPEVEADSNNPNSNDDVLAAYEAWLKAWKPPPDNKQWHLWIGLEREKGQVEEAWKQADCLFPNGYSRFLRIMVKSNREPCFSTKSVDQIYDENDPKGSDLRAYWEAERKAEMGKKKSLLFDNHGNCFQTAEVEKTMSLKDSTRFYQKLSGSVSPDLFRMLSRPPKDPFGFRFFVYSLAEACLTNVVVVDERLAWSLVEGGSGNQSNKNFAHDLLEHQKAGIFPVFRFRQLGAGKDLGFYTTKHKQLLVDSTNSSTNGNFGENHLENEGITFDVRQNKEMEMDNNCLSLIIPTKKDDVEYEISSDLKADVILIHEGAMDILKSQQGVDWKGIEDPEEHRKQLQALYKLAPMIIRTSGRGRKSKLLGEELPFIEFGQVSSSLLTARNKFSLVRGLLGSVGREHNDENMKH
jgi:hypothetical protein